jgi:acetyltransferase
VVRVNTIAELFSMAEALAKQPRPAGPRLAILTNAGGPGVLATDALLAGGGALAPLAPGTVAALDGFLPPHWSRGNPVDILGDAEPERYARALETVAKDPTSDGLLVVLTPQAMTDPTRTAELLAPYARTRGKPVLASWLGGDDVAGGEATLNRVGIPTFPYPDTAARVFALMWRYSRDLQTLYETPTLAAGADSRAAADAGARIVGRARDAGRTILTEVESKQLLAAYGIPTVETHVARDEAAAVARADALGYPVVLKLFSETITHKTDVDGVRLDLADAAAVRRAYRAIEAAVRERPPALPLATGAGAEHFLGVTVQPMVALDGYELILGSSSDPQFGPVLLFGSGGRLVEVVRDRALALPPLTTTLARRLMERTRVFTALQGVRGRPPVDLAALEQLLVRFSQLVVEQRWIEELDINPLLASPGRLLALDARVIVHGREVGEEALPRPAIRPYPAQYAAPWTLRDGTTIAIRPIRPEDEPLLVEFHQALSERTVYLRYFQALRLDRRVAHERLMRICFVDYDREMALVAERADPATGGRRILGVGRLSKEPGRPEAEYALLLRDDAQGRGLGTELLRRLVRIGRDEGLRRITARILPDNIAMQRISEKLGFRLRHDMAAGEVAAAIEL